MRKILFVFVAMFCFVPAVFAEKIDPYLIKLNVNPDSSLDVTEEIHYDSEGLDKHGIFRDIRLKSFNNDPISISRIKCAAPDGKPYKFSRAYSSGNVRLKIGDPDRTFSGKNTYIITYRIENALGSFDKYDEIYWNATGNNWPFYIDDCRVSVNLPAGASTIQSVGYFGNTGSTMTFPGDGKGNFAYQGMLPPGSGVTVAVGFTKGFVRHKPNLTVLIAGVINTLVPLMPVIVFVFMFLHWYRYGRDPKSGRTIIPQYEAPDSMTPLEAAALFRQNAGAREISAEIIHLAVNGRLKIEKTEEKVLFIKVEDYVLTKLPDERPVPEADRKIMSGLFSGNDQVKMSSLKEQFYVHIPGIIKSVLDWLAKAGYYKGNPQAVFYKYLAIAGLLLLFTILTPVIFSSTVFFSTDKKAFMFLGSGLLCSIIVLIFGGLMPVKTEKGLAAREHLLGLREYLDVAEKDRIKFHNAPEKSPELFEKFLPYAMIFGLEKAWAKEFEGIYKEPTSGWYTDRNAGAFSALGLVSGMRGFSDYASSTISSTPNSSGSGGSGGGGSSGGGGGGGGGGSW